MNIEEFVNDYLQEHRHDVLLNPYNGLIDFANAFKEQMLKDAVDGEVIIYGGLWQFYAPDLDTILRKMDEGDKVKIIIVKEG